jgi:CarD family transcriptional regulator
VRVENSSRCNRFIHSTSQPSQGRGRALKTKSTGLKTSKVKSSKTSTKQSSLKAIKKSAPTSVKTKTGVTLSAVKGAKVAQVSKAKAKAIVAPKVSVAEKLSQSHLVKRAEVVELKAKKASLTLVAKQASKVPATKISRSEPTSPGNKIITGKFSVETSIAATVLTSKTGVDSAASSNGSAGSAILFKSGDKIVYPGHGVGEIEGIRTTVLGGQEHHIYNIKILDSGMKVMVPVSQASAVGLRKIIDKKAIDEVFSILKDRDFKIDTQTWNRRFREYSQKIKTGSVFEIAVVLRDLSVLSADKELSFGEKKMLDMAETLLVSEIAIAKARPHDKVVGELRALFA